MLFISFDLRICFAGFFCLFFLWRYHLFFNFFLNFFLFFLNYHFILFLFFLRLFFTSWSCLFFALSRHFCGGSSFNSFFRLPWPIFLTGECFLSPGGGFLNNLVDPFQDIFRNVILFFELPRCNNYIMCFLSDFVSDLLTNFQTAIVYLFECIWRHVGNKGGKDLIKILILAGDIDFVEAEAAEGQDREKDEPIATIFEGGSLVHFILDRQKGTIC